MKLIFDLKNTASEILLCSRKLAANPIEMIMPTMLLAMGSWVGKVSFQSFSDAINFRGDQALGFVGSGAATIASGASLIMAFCMISDVISEKEFPIVMEENIDNLVDGKLENGLEAPPSRPLLPPPNFKSGILPR